MTDKLESLVNRLEAAVGKLEKFKSGGGGGGGEDSGENLYADFLNQYFTPLTEATKAMPEPLQNYVKLFRVTFDEVDKFLQNTRANQKPGDDDLKAIVKVYKDTVKEFLKFGLKVPADYKNHCKALEEAVKANNWIISTAPVSEVHNNWDIGDYHALKIKSPPQDLAWAKALRNLMVNLEQFVKDNYKMGVSWNAKGGTNALSFSGSATPATPASAPAPAAASAPASGSAPVAKVDLAAALAAGKDGTSAFGLKKLKDEDKTKNRPAEEKKFTVPSELGPKAAPKATATPAKVLPPKWDKQANKLSIENYLNDKKLTYEADEDGKDVLYLYGNTKIVLRVSRKINSMTIDKCVNTSVVVDDVISSIELVNSKNITIQLNGVAASIVVDSTDEVKIYITDKGAEKLEVFSSKSGNIVLYKPCKNKDPDTGEEYDGHLELPVPGTVRSVIVKDNLDNTFVKHG